MIKKILICLFVMLLCMFPKVVYAEDLKLAPNAASSVLMEASTKHHMKQTSYSQHPQQKL